MTRLNRILLNDVVTMLQDQHDLAETPEDQRAIQSAIEALHPILRPWPPNYFLIAMLNTGYDTWVADLLGRGREEVRNRRRNLQIDPMSHGGSVTERRRDREAWVAYWTERLRGRGYLPNEQQQAG